MNKNQKLRDILAIDQLQLDREWVEQPDLYLTYATALADARLDLEETKSELDVTSSEVARDIRENPSTYGVDKITEATVKELVPLQEAYQDAQAAVHKAKHKVDILQAAVNALDHRKRALENLVDLHGQNYFSTPRADESNRERMEEVKERAVRSRGQRKARKRKDEDDE